ncbi:MAG: phosphoadenosine phosphosulfate reductase family protein [Beijerinckiaceae bacterium]|nr:phosphoadenosine phosphosulfate reductase family protein [Beijerinckiaceae bacterium]
MNSATGETCLAPGDGEAIPVAAVSREKHVLGLSGGRDSAALAVYMRQHHPELDIEYFFTDTGKELPEVYEYLGRLEGFLGKEILKLNPDRNFDFWLKQYNTFLPSPQTRWCTRQLKLRPFEQWLRPMLDSGVNICSYVAIRADEEYREGYSSKHGKLVVRLPFKEAGIDKAGVLEILEAAGLGLPKYYAWRTRSGCTFCFFQQKIEWVRLREQHPDAFEQAKTYEKNALEHGSPFTWSQGESLDELSQPDRVAQIKREHEQRLARMQARLQPNPLRIDNEPLDIDDLYGKAKGCLACHK